MSDDIKKLRQSRSNIKGRITIFKKHIDLLKSIDPGQITKLQLTELQLKLERFQALFSQFDELQSKIEALDLESEGELDERESFEEAFCSLISCAQLIIENVSQAQSACSWC